MVTFKVLSNGVLQNVFIDGYEPVIKIPKSIDGVVITKISRTALQGNLSIRCVYIPNTVIDLNFFCFQDCDNLETIFFEEGSQLQFIGEGCFSRCKKLTNINMEVLENLMLIDSKAFENCKSLTCMNLQNSKISTIFTGTFYCSGLETIQLPQTIERIYPHAFSNTNVDINFDDIPNLEIIEPEAFRNSGITVVDFSKNVCGELFINGGVFKDCSKLKSVYLPKSAVLNHGSIFENCPQLKKIKIDTASHFIPPETFKDCTKLSIVDILDSELTVIGSSAFLNCASLKSIAFPESVDYIDEEAFANCDLSDNVDLTRVGDDFTLADCCFEETCINEKSIKLDFLKPITIEGNPFENSSYSLKMFKQAYPFVISNSALSE